VDEALLESARRGGEGAARFWVSRRAVIIGRSQAVESECDTQALRQLGIPVLRRASGGGAVYHYPGNLNVSATFPDARRLGSVEEGFRRFGKALSAGLSTLGAEVEAGERMLLARRAKISGAAQARRGRAVLLHATVLVSPDEIDMSVFLRALHPGYSPLGTPSRPRATTTLSDAVGHPLDMRDVADAVRRALEAEFDETCEPGAMTPAERALGDEMEGPKYRSREWNESR
jgi:lipoate---protein ligase